VRSRYGLKNSGAEVSVPVTKVNGSEASIVDELYLAIMEILVPNAQKCPTKDIADRKAVVK
jgi:hypothetical protein